MAGAFEESVKSHPIAFMTGWTVLVVGLTVSFMSFADSRWRSHPTTSPPTAASHLDPQTVLTATTNQVSHMHAFMANGQLVTPRLDSADAFTKSLYAHQLWATGFIALDKATLFALFKERASPELFAQFERIYGETTDALNAMQAYFRDINDGKRPLKSLTQDQVDREFLDLRNAAQERIATLTGFLASRSASDFK